MSLLDRNVCNEHLIIDACCGQHLVNSLQKLGLYAQWSPRVRPIGWNGMHKDRAILRYCKMKGAILVTKDHVFAERAKKQDVRVIELYSMRGFFKASEEAYIVLSKLGFLMHHFMLTTQVHFGLIFNLTGNKKRPTVLRPEIFHRYNRIIGTDPLFQLPTGETLTSSERQSLSIGLMPMKRA